ncbi:MAG: 50S ribosomal protein L32e [Aigarchaeota archaeon]|nr:50S ribosomal protein L32e [Aigarchaeota archaeon]MCX8193080.1 50S ribosomal protein L32e [Nitrososphaeria archaeon]MDW7986929.1 50S ribosomal protein L32e [Nitrososphaerota archaeon]
MSPVEIPKRIREMKNKRPDFVRQESWRYVRLKPNWRKPRGKDSKMRLQKSGAPQLVKVGYRTPKAYRDLHPSGLKEVLVHRIEELEDLNPEVHAVRIAGSVGKMKKIKIMQEAEKKGLKVLNPIAIPTPEVEKPEIIRPEEIEEKKEEGGEVEKDAGQT